MQNLHITKSFFPCATSNFKAKYLDIIPCFQNLGSTCSIFKLILIALTSDECFPVEEMSLQHKYAPLNVVFVDKKTRRTFLSL